MRHLLFAAVVAFSGCSNLALNVSTLPVGTYRVVVVLDADDAHLAREAGFGVFHCVYM